MFQDELPLRDHNIDFAGTVLETLWGLMEEAYGYIITEWTGSEGRRERENELITDTHISGSQSRMFQVMMHHWAIHATSHFSNIIRHCVNTEEEFVVLANKMIVSQIRTRPLRV